MAGPVGTDERYKQLEFLIFGDRPPVRVQGVPVGKVCSICGGLIANTLQHARFHETHLGD